MAERLLILGGTTEAAQLARRAVETFGERLEVTTSLAGRLDPPRGLAGRVRVGGFGGVAGMAETLRDLRIDFAVDATHPFASMISANAVEACETANVPRLMLIRPPWRPEPGHPGAGTRLGGMAEYPPANWVASTRSMRSSRSAATMPATPPKPMRDRFRRSFGRGEAAGQQGGRLKPLAEHLHRPAGPVRRLRWCAREYNSRSRPRRRRGRPAGPGGEHHRLDPGERGNDETATLFTQRPWAGQATELGKGQHLGGGVGAARLHRTSSAGADAIEQRRQPVHVQPRLRRMPGRWASLTILAKPPAMVSSGSGWVRAAASPGSSPVSTVPKEQRHKDKRKSQYERLQDIV